VADANEDSSRRLYRLYCATRSASRTGGRCLGWRREGAVREAGRRGSGARPDVVVCRLCGPMRCGDGRSLERGMSVRPLPVSRLFGCSAVRLFGDRSADRCAALRRHGRTFEARARPADEERCARGEECPNADNYRQSAHASLLNRGSRLLFGGLPSQRVDDCSVRRRPGIRLHEKKRKSTLIHVMESWPLFCASFCRRVVIRTIDGDAHNTSYARRAAIVKRPDGDRGPRPSANAGECRIASGAPT